MGNPIYHFKPACSTEDTVPEYPPSFVLTSITIKIINVLKDLKKLTTLNCYP
jgi:hypothetical protein